MFEIHPVKKVSVVIPVYNEQESGDAANLLI